MTLSERENFDKILIAMAEIYETTLSEERLSLYFEALKDMSFEEFKAAANKVARTTRFFPKPVDFREAVSMSVDDKALQALTKLEDTMKHIGQYRSVAFDDKAIHGVVEALGGWEACCVMHEADWKWKRKEFIELYKVFVANPRPYPEKLIGFHERINIFNGHPEHVEKPVLIGDEHKAMAVLTHKEG